MPKIRIKDIARLANVSTGTVDRVIHGRDGVSEATRRRVEMIIEKYDYQPDILAGALASNKTYRLMVCMPDVVNAHAFWKLPELGVKKALEELRHFDLQVEFLRFDQHSKSDFLDKVQAVDVHQYNGLLFAPVFSDVSSEFLFRWKEAGIPCIQFNSRVEDIAADGFIGQDAFQSGFLGGRLISYGLPSGRDLLVVNLSLRKDNYQHIIRREHGFRAYFEEHSDRVSNLVSVNLNGGDYTTVAEEIARRMDAHNVAGIFVTNSRVHLVARYLAERGAMNIRLIGYDLLTESVEYLKREYIDYLISQSPEEQAYLGIRQLFSLVVLKRKQPQQVLLPIDILTKENVDYYLNFNAQYEQSE
jgi:LacI family transcriptional regulator